MRVFVVLSLCLAAGRASADATVGVSERIVGGSVTTINVYPFMTALLHSYTGGGIFQQSAGGSIINSRSILSAAHCFIGAGADQPYNWRIRVGSSYASGGGVIHNTARIIIHPQYNRNTNDMDIALLRSATTFTFIASTVEPARIAGPSYYLADNSVVWAAGWGLTTWGGVSSEQLRHVQVWTVNQNVCMQRYNELRSTITGNMLCSGWLDMGGRDQCTGDSGGPLVHSGVVVGVTSWGQDCAHPRYPGVNARVSSASTWIQTNA